MRLFTLPFTVALLLVFTSCAKDEHQVRFDNQFELQINNVTIGSDGFGDIPPGQSSTYKELPQGQLTITGQSNKGYITGTAHISGKGEHQWTVRLLTDQSIILVKDK